MTDVDARPPSLVLPGLLGGIGLGGFLDGIVLHQLLQWHLMLSHTEAYPTTTVAGLQANTLADGLFHVVAWIAVLAGVLLLVQRVCGRPRGLFGLALGGWGLFNLVEGIVDHHLLGVHHVREGAGALGYDLAYLGLGALLLGGGWLLYKRAVTAPTPAPATARR